MEVREVVDLPFLVYSVHCDPRLGRGGIRRVRTEDNHVESAGRDIIDPFCRKSPNAVERGKVDLFCIYKLVSR